jgi:hypothetical protein
MTHFMRQFGPLIDLPWSKLKGPAITPELVERLVEGTKAQAGGKSIQQLERFRDDCLIEVEKVLAKVRERHGIDVAPNAGRSGKPARRAAKPARRASKPVAKKAQRRVAPGKSRPLTQSRKRPAKR